MQDSGRCEETGECERIAVGQKTVDTCTLVPTSMDENYDVNIDPHTTHAQSTAADATATIAARPVPTRHIIDIHQEAADPALGTPWVILWHAVLGAELQAAYSGTFISLLAHIAFLLVLWQVLFITPRARHGSSCGTHQG